MNGASFFSSYDNQQTNACDWYDGRLSNEKMDLGTRNDYFSVDYEDKDKGINSSMSEVSENHMGSHNEINLSFMEEDNENDDVSEIDYHNKASEYARKGKLRNALDVSIQGLKKFPNNIDLCADSVKYSSEIGENEIAKKYFNILYKSVPRHLWNWRAFTFLLDYLLKDPIANEKICRELILDYYKYLPYEEKAAVAEAEFEEKIGNYEKSKDILQKTISARFNAPQCALKLIDIQVKQGEYRDALRTHDYYTIASCEAQPSTNQNYESYMYCIIEDALLRLNYYETGNISKADVLRVKDLYEKALMEPEILIQFGANIRSRIRMLEIIQMNGKENMEVI